MRKSNFLIIINVMRQNFFIFPKNRKKKKNSMDNVYPKLKELENY